jgi:quercetin dioxygenase-like cupin family protein
MSRDREDPEVSRSALNVYQEETMIIKKLSDVPYADLQGYENVKKQVVIGPEDGSEEIVMRYFTLAPGGSSPHHTHDWPHLVRIETGTGVVIDPSGNERPVAAGDYVYVNDNETHQFRNTGAEPFAFICIVPRRGEG